MRAQRTIRRCRNSWEMLSLEEALLSLEQGTPPLPLLEDFACILHKCRKERNLAHALRLLACMRRNGLEAHRSLGNHLVSLLVEVGSMQHAQQVFDGLGYRNECSWNSLITGYIHCGKSKYALILYQKMQEDDSVHPTERTFVALLKACTKLRDLERGLAIHAEVAKMGLLERNLFVGATLVDMYAKCGSLGKAQQVFDNLPAARDVVSWNALISGYAEHERGEEALKCFEQMQLEGLFPNAITFVCGLKACGSIRATDKGQEIHAEIVRMGFLERNLFVGNTLVDMYAKCGLLAKAQEVFDNLPVRDTISCNALIAGYAENGHGEEALKCFEQMKLEGVSPNAVTYICSLKACGSIGDKDKGREIHADLARQGLLERDLVVGNALVDMYAKCGLLVKAQEVFDKLPVRDVVSCNVLITGYTEHRHGREAVKCFEQMQLEGITPDAITFICSLKACGSTGAIDKGQEIHAEIAKKGLLEGDLVVGNTLVDMYAKCGWLVEAQDVLDKLPVRDTVSWNALTVGFAEHGHGEEALKCFEQMQLEGISPNAVTFVCMLKACGSIRATDKGHEIHAEIARQGLLERDPFVGSALVDMYTKCGSPARAQKVFDKLLIRDAVLWNALMAGYVEHEHGKEALECFEQMQLEGVSPDAATLVCGLKACGSIGATDRGREIHAEIARKGFLETDLVVGNTLVNMYAKCGSLAEAQEVLIKLQVRDVVSWNALIAGYAQFGESESVLHVFDRMIGEGVKPNAVTFVSVLKACSHAGLFDKGQIFYEAMSQDHGIIPTLEHHNCMIDLLGHAGQLDKALAMIEKMPSYPNLVVWDSVLGACRKWGNVELGRQAFENAVQLDAKDAGAYVLMSYIYADADMQEEANKLEAMRLQKTSLEDTMTFLADYC